MSDVFTPIDPIELASVGGGFQQQVDMSETFIQLSRDLQQQALSLQRQARGVKPLPATTLRPPFFSKA